MVWRLSAGVIVCVKRSAQNAAKKANAPKHNGPTSPATKRHNVGNQQNDWQVMLVRRGSGSSFMPNAHIFPGGKVDKADEIGPYRGSTVSRDRKDNLMFKLCAARELFEEAGLFVGNLRGAMQWCVERQKVVLPSTPSSSPGDSHSTATSNHNDSAAANRASTPPSRGTPPIPSASEVAVLRKAVYDTPQLFRDLYDNNFVNLDALTYALTLITPDIEMERQLKKGKYGFDTAFFICRVDENGGLVDGQGSEDGLNASNSNGAAERTLNNSDDLLQFARTDDTEVHDLLWGSPEEILPMAGESIFLGPPQYYVLNEMLGVKFDELVDHIRGMPVWQNCPMKPVPRFEEMVSEEMNAVFENGTDKGADKSVNNISNLSGGALSRDSSSLKKELDVHKSGESSWNEAFNQKGKFSPGDGSNSSSAANEGAVKSPKPVDNKSTSESSKKSTSDSAARNIKSWPVVMPGDEFHPAFPGEKGMRHRMIMTVGKKFPGTLAGVDCNFNVRSWEDFAKIRCDEKELTSGKL